MWLYPIDAVHPDKFAELLGKPRTAVVEMIKANKLPVVEFRDPNQAECSCRRQTGFHSEFNRGA